MPDAPVTRWTLRLDAWRPAGVPPAPFAVRRVEAPAPALYRQLYREVGGPWHWTDKSAWNDARIDAHWAEPGRELWLAEVAGALAGFFELARGDDGAVEVCLLGLLPDRIGRGYGPALIDAALARALALAPSRVWLSTCSRDHPRALNAYRARGFVIETEETVPVTPERTAP